MTLTAGGWLAERERATKSEDLIALITLLNQLCTADRPSVEEDSRYAPILEAIERYDLRSAHNRIFFVTRMGMPGIGPKVMRAGDIVAVLRGSGVPFVLRPLEGEQYQLAGAAYVWGVMYGEVVEECRAIGEEEVVFALI